MKQYKVNSSEGRLILLATILASGMAFLIGSALTIAVPRIQTDLHASISNIQWILNAYTLMESSFLLISGSLGDRFGRKKVFRIGMSVFIIGCFLSALSRSLPQLIALQALEGLGAAMMVPGSLSIINSSFEISVRGKAIGLWSGLSGAIATLGPLLGGFLVQQFSWQSIFFINVPLGIIALIITSKYIPESKNEESTKLDLLGTVLITLALLGIAFGLMNAPSAGWQSPLILISIIGGVAAFVGFIIQEKNTAQPLVPLKIFKSGLVTGANLATLMLYFALAGLLFFLVLNFQQVQGLAPTLAGLALLPPILIISFFSGPAGSLSDKIGPRTQMILGPLLVSAGMASFIFSGVGSNYFFNFLPGLILFGSGMALVIAPLTKSALSVDSKYSGAASGVNNAVARVAGLLAVALLGAIALSVFKTNLEKNINNSMLTAQEKQLILIQENRLGGIDVPKSFSKLSREESQRIIKNSFIQGFRVTIGVNALLAFLAALAGFVFIKNPKS